MYRVEQTEDASEALEGARPFLLGRPVEHSLVLGILDQRQARPEPGLYWSVLDGPDVVGFALQSPRHFFATVTPLPPHAVACLVDALAAAVPDLPGINGEACTVAAIGGHWSERADVEVVPLEAHRLYRLDRAPAVADAPGALRTATVDDEDLLVAWAGAFLTEIGLPYPGDIAEATRQRIADRGLWVWDDDGPACAVGATLPISGVSRIHYVYSPPERRRRGYATAAVASVSAHLLAAEAATCVLYAQLTNPTANRLYRAVGYRVASEILFYRFGSAGVPTSRTRPSPGTTSPRSTDPTPEARRES